MEYSKQTYRLAFNEEVAKHDLRPQKKLRFVRKKLLYDSKSILTKPDYSLHVPFKTEPAIRLNSVARCTEQKRSFFQTMRSIDVHGVLVDFQCSPSLIANLHGCPIHSLSLLYCAQ